MQIQFTKDIMLGVMQKWATFSNHAYDRNADKATAS
jgi:hypothetical protein